MEDLSGIIEALIALGFTNKEAQIYLCLLKFQEVHPATLARLCNIKRASIYSILENLEQKGVCTSEQKNGQRVYVATSIQTFLLKQKSKLTSFDDSIKKLETELSELNLKPKNREAEGNTNQDLGEFLSENYEGKIGGIAAFFTTDVKTKKVKLLGVAKNSDCHYALKIIKSIDLLTTPYCKPQNYIGRTAKLGSEYTGASLPEFISPTIPTSVAEKMQKLLKIKVIATFPATYRGEILGAILAGFRSEEEFIGKQKEIRKFGAKYAKMLFLTNYHKKLQMEFKELFAISREKSQMEGELLSFLKDFFRRAKDSGSKSSHIDLIVKSEKILKKFESRKKALEQQSTQLFQQVEKFDNDKELSML